MSSTVMIIIVTAAATIWLTGIILLCLFYALFPKFLGWFFKLIYPDVLFKEVTDSALEEFKQWNDKERLSRRDMLMIVFWPIDLIAFCFCYLTQKKGTN